MEGRATINCAVANCKSAKSHLNLRARSTMLPHCSARSPMLTSELGTSILHELAQWDRSPIRWKTTSWTNSSGFITLHAWTASQQDDWNRCLRNHIFNEKLNQWCQQIQPFSERTSLAIKMIEVVHVCLHNLSSSISLPSFLKTSDANVFSFAMHRIYLCVCWGRSVGVSPVIIFYSSSRCNFVYFLCSK